MNANDALIGFDSSILCAFISFHQFNLTRNLFQSAQAHFDVSMNPAFPPLFVGILLNNCEGRCVSS